MELLLGCHGCSWKARHTNTSLPIANGEWQISPILVLTEQLSIMSLVKGDVRMKEAMLIALATIGTSR